MKYDFTTVIDRRGRDAWAIDGVGGGGMAPKGPGEGFDLIPMWVADMNFATVPTVPQALCRRAEHPVYGYFSPPRGYYDAILRWQRERNGVQGLEPEHIGYENGVLGGVISALGAVCSRGDGVLVHSPTYIGFTKSLEGNGYRIVLSPLVRDGEGVWRMDLEDMEKKLREEKLHAAILCSPHNPCGRVWEEWELREFLELCRKYDVYVISDEIWSDILRPGYRHIPTQSVSDDARRRTVALYAPSKTFNLAGLVGSYHIIYDRWLRERVERESSLCHYNEMNVLSMHALMAAYEPQGAEWLEELRQVLAANVDYACDYIGEHFDGVEVFKPQGTYMLFVDCSGWCREHGKTIEELEEMAWKVGVAVQDGRMFHGPCHLRINLALPLERVKEAFSRLDRYVFHP